MSKHGMVVEWNKATVQRQEALFEAWNRENKPLFSATVNEDKTAGEVTVHGVIGADGFFEQGITAKQFDESIASLGPVKEITVHINSPGGLIGEGMAMYNTLVRHPAKVITNVVGWAASAASFFLQAGDVRQMSETSTAMIHPAQGGGFGDDMFLRNVANVLEKLTGVIANTYASRSGRKPETFVKLMRADEQWGTYFTAQEALEHRLIDVVVPNKGPANVAKVDFEAMGMRSVSNTAALSKAMAMRARLLEVEAASADMTFYTSADSRNLDIGAT